MLHHINISIMSILLIFTRFLIEVSIVSSRLKS